MAGFMFVICYLSKRAGDKAGMTGDLKQPVGWKGTPKFRSRWGR
jgi:hypothetical protein